MNSISASFQIVIYISNKNMNHLENWQSYKTFKSEIYRALLLTHFVALEGRRDYLSDFHLVPQLLEFQRFLVKETVPVDLLDIRGHWREVHYCSVGVRKT